MSTSRGSDVSNGGVVQPIPSGSRKVVESLKEIVNCSEAEIYATLKECNITRPPIVCSIKGFLKEEFIGSKKN
ncbi:hypothetical protein OROHE_014678 [Orobanche hederae]